MTSTALATAAKGALAEPPPLEFARCALFADLDGTLAAIRARPQDVGPDDRRASLLDRLSAALGGRFAVISGRSLEDLDRVLEGRVPALAAVHGLVRRTADGRVIVAPDMRQFVMVGICGGYTTFSSFSLQTLNLVQQGEVLQAGANIGASVILCLIAVWLGYAAAQAVNVMKGS